MKLSTRLNTLCQCLSENKVIADIGSDHAYLCVAYILNRKGKKAYACDINQNALNQAKQTIEKYPKISVTLQLMDGIQQLANDVEEIVIAGMGYDTICHILSNQQSTLRKLDKIVIQCNKNIELMKQFLNKEKIFINRTHIVFENGIYYEILECSMKQSKISKTIEDNGNYIDYLDFQISKITQIENYTSNDKLKMKYEQLNEKRIAYLSQRDS